MNTGLASQTAFAITRACPERLLQKAVARAFAAKATGV